MAGDTKSFWQAFPAYMGFMRVTIAPSLIDNGYCQCAYMVTGVSAQWGKTLNRGSLALEDFSVAGIDAFGTETTTKRDARQILNLSTMIDAGLAYNLTQQVRRLLSTVIVVIGDERPNSRLQNLIMLGKINDDGFSVPVVEEEYTIDKFKIVETIAVS